MVVVGLVLPVALKNGKLATIRTILRSFGVNIITGIWIRKIENQCVNNIFVLRISFSISNLFSKK